MPIIDITELIPSTKRRSSRTDIAFDCLYRVYKDGVRIELEELDSNTYYARTFYHKGDYSQDIDDAFDEFFSDTIDLTDLLLGCDPSFRLHDHFDEDGEFFISIMGVFKEETYTEGSYEEGYYDCLRLIPEVISYEMVDKNDAKLFVENTEDDRDGYE